MDPVTATLPVVPVSVQSGAAPFGGAAVGHEPAAVAVPDAAVLRDTENQPFVYINQGGNQFGRRSVTLGESMNGQTQVTAGLKAGDRIIGDGSLFLQFANSLQR